MFYVRVHRIHVVSHNFQKEREREREREGEGRERGSLLSGQCPTPF